MSEPIKINGVEFITPNKLSEYIQSWMTKNNISVIITYFDKGGIQKKFKNFSTAMENFYHMNKMMEIEELNFSVYSFNDFWKTDEAIVRSIMDYENQSNISN